MFTQVGFIVLWSTARSASDFHIRFDQEFCECAGREFMRQSSDREGAPLILGRKGVTQACSKGGLMKVLPYLLIAIAIIIGTYLVIAGAANLIDEYDGGMRDMIALKQVIWT